MTLRGFRLEYDFYYSHDYRLIILETKNNKYYFEYKKGNGIHEIDITEKIDYFCQGLYDMNIEEWNHKQFDSPMDFFPSYYWNLYITTDDMNIECGGKDNYPKNWSALEKLLNEIGLVDFKIPR